MTDKFFEYVGMNNFEEKIILSYLRGVLIAKLAIKRLI